MLAMGRYPKSRGKFAVHSVSGAGPQSRGTRPIGGTVRTLTSF